MSRLFALAAVVIFGISTTLVACAHDDPRYADPPPGSASPYADPDERGTGDRVRDEPQEPADEEDDEEPPEPPPERN